LLCKKKKEFIVPWATRTDWGNTQQEEAQAASLLPVRRRWSGQGLQCRGLLWSAAVGISWSSESGIWGPGVEHRWRTLGLELGNADRRRALYCLAWATTPATLEALELSNFSKQTTAR